MSSSNQVRVPLTPEIAGLLTLAGWIWFRHHRAQLRDDEALHKIEKFQALTHARYGIRSLYEWTYNYYGMLHRPDVQNNPEVAAAVKNFHDTSTADITRERDVELATAVINAIRKHLDLPPEGVAHA